MGYLLLVQIVMYRRAMYRGFVSKDVQLNLACEKEYHDTISRRHGSMPAGHWQRVLVGDLPSLKG